VTARFRCPHLKGDVEWTEERGRHIVERHPDLLPDPERWIAGTLADPDQIRRSAAFGSARLFSRWFPELRGGKHVVAVVVSEPAATPRHWLVTACITRRLAPGDVGMEAKLTFKYDREADILYIGKRAPYPEQASEELGDEVVARLNPATGEVENLEILFFSTRLLRGDLFELPVTADLRLALKR
jgi:uncharacterized protein YuzE